MLATRQGVVQGSAWLIVASLCSKSAQVIITVSIAAFLTPRQLGFISLVTVIVNFAQAAQSVGTHDAILRTRQPPRFFAGTVATVSVAISLLISSTLVLTADALAVLVRLDNPNLLRLAAFGLPFFAYGGVQQSMMQREFQMRLRIVPDAGSAFLGATTTVVLAAAGLGEWSVVSGMVVSALAQPILGLLVGIRIPLTFDRRSFSEILRWSVIDGPGTLTGILVINLDYVVAVRIAGAQATGLYSLAYRIAFMPYSIVTISLSAAAFSVYTRLLREGNPKGMHEAFAAFLHAVVLVAGSCYVILALVSDRVVVLSATWRESGPVLAILCGYGVMLSIELTCFSALRALGHVTYYLLAQLSHALLLFVSLLAFTKSAGITGTALAQVVASFVIAAACILLLKTLGAVTLPVVAQAFSRPVAAFSITGVIGIFLKGVNGLRDRSSILEGVTFGSIMMIVLLASLIVVDRERVWGAVAFLASKIDLGEETN